MRVGRKLSGCEGVGGCVCGGMKGNLSGCEGGEDVWGKGGVGKLCGCEGGEDVWGKGEWGNCVDVRVGRMCEVRTLLKSTHV